MSTSVKLHDFHRPDLVDRVRMNALEALFDGFVRHGAVELSTMLRTPCQLSVIRLDQVGWDEVRRRVPDQANFVLFTVAPLPGNLLVAMSQRAVAALVDLRMGGTGRVGESGRPLTEIDQALAAPVIEAVLGELPRSFAKLLAMRVKLVGQELNPQFVGIAGPQETCVVVTLEAHVEGLSSEPVHMVWPAASLAPLLEMLRPSVLSRGAQSAGEVARVDPGRVDESPVDLTVRFPKVTLASGDLMELSTGTVIALGQRVDAPLEVVVGDVLVATADRGVVGSKLVARIAEGVAR